MENIKVALADDQQLFRHGLAKLIKAVPDFDLVIEAANGKLFLEQLQQSAIIPDVALIDMHMPEMNGVELNDILQKKYPYIKVIVLSVYDQERFISKMIQSGACGYLTKNCETEELVTAIRTTCKTGFYFNNDTLHAMRRVANYKESDIRSLNNIPIELSGRELEVLQLICKELTNTEIGTKLFISPRTVEGHRNNLLAKAGCRNTAGLVIFAIKNELYQIGL
ncbi:MAG: response regulator transcription factor [Ferruginibacter sp.]